jgi:hypothetical protein
VYLLQIGWVPEVQLNAWEVDEHLAANTPMQTFCRVQPLAPHVRISALVPQPWPDGVPQPVQGELNAMQISIRAQLPEFVPAAL